MSIARLASPSGARRQRADDIQPERPSAGTGRDGDPPTKSAREPTQHGPCGSGTDGLRPAQLPKVAPRIVRGRSSPGKGAQDPSSGAAREASWACSLARRAAATPAGGFAAEG